MCMLSEDEVRNWKNMEKERLDAIKDNDARRYCLIAIAVLDGVLND